jgi:hypothetical protein
MARMALTCEAVAGRRLARVTLVVAGQPGDLVLHSLLAGRLLLSGLQRTREKWLAAPEAPTPNLVGILAGLQGHGIVQFEVTHTKASPWKRG